MLVDGFIPGDPVERAFIELLYALQKTPPDHGMVPGELIYWAEVNARFVADVLKQLDEYRVWRKRYMESV